MKPSNPVQTSPMGADMAIREMSRIVGLGLIIIVSTILLSGCSSVQSYSGSALPQDQVAVLNFFSSSSDFGFLAGVRPIAIDGKGVNLWCGSRVCWTKVTSIQVLPGHHTITFAPDVPGSAVRYDVVSTEVDIEAGKTYRAKPVYHVENSDSSFNGRVMSSSSSGTWSVEIFEEK